MKITTEMGINNVSLYFMSLYQNSKYKYKMGETQWCNGLRAGLQPQSK